MFCNNAAYVGAFYFAGLSVECLLRAYRYRVDPVFDARHDLYELTRVSGFFSPLNTDEVKRAARLLEDVTVRWSNTHRYRSERALRSFLIKAGLYRLRGAQTVRGEVVPYNARIIVSAATELVELGIEKWELLSQPI